MTYLNGAPPVSYKEVAMEVYGRDSALTSAQIELCGIVAELLNDDRGGAKTQGRRFQAALKEAHQGERRVRSWLADPDHDTLL